MLYKLAHSIAQISIITLMAYSAIVKLIDNGKFQLELLQSPLLPEGVTSFLSVTIPSLEILVVIFLFATKPILQRFGFLLSFFLMLSFTLYLLVLSTKYVNVPCSCGGILGGMSYPMHIAFNIVFTLIALLGIYSYKNEKIT